MAAGEPKKFSSIERLDGLLKDDSLSGSRDSNQFSIPKIQRVQPYLRNRVDFAKYYCPKLLSFGPIHHGHGDLKLGEQQKCRWAKAYLGGNADTAKELRQKIADNITSLKEFYMEDAIEKFKDDDDYLVWMLFVDGCSILHVMNNADKQPIKASDMNSTNNAENQEIKASDMTSTDNGEMKAAEALEIKIDQLALLRQDMLLLENQLPYELLVLLTGDSYKPEQSMLKFLQNHKLVKGSNTDHKMVRGSNTDKTNNDGHEITIDEPPAHLLDHLYKILVGRSTPSPSQSPQAGDHQHLFHLLLLPLRILKKALQLLFLLLLHFLRKPSHTHQPTNSYKMRNIKELKEAGISVVRSRNESIEDVNFNPTSCWFWAWGYLELPEIIVDDFAAFYFMNLIAYEMCPDFRSNFDISSYVAFLDLLIDHEDDVKELRSAGVLQNHLGNDEEVAKLFNIISTDLIADGSKYANARYQIEEHCSRKRNTWMAKLLSEHFSSPWTIVAFVAGFILFALTVVQTAFTIRPLK